MMWALVSAGSSVVKGSGPSVVFVVVILEASHPLGCAISAKSSDDE